MEREGVTLQVPPHSIHFDAKACMKPPKTVTVDSVVVQEGQNPAPAPQAQLQPLAYPPFLPWMYHYPPQGYPPWYPLPSGVPLQGSQGPNHYLPGPMAQNNSPFSSLGQALCLHVPLEDF